MASSGNFSNTFKTGYKLQVEWVINSQSIAANTSNVTVTAYLISAGSSYTINSSYPKTVKLMINGTTYTDSISNGTLTGGQKRQIMSKTVTITHSTDGSKSIALQCSLGIKATLSGTYFDTVYAPASGSKIVTLDTITRATTPTTSGTFNVGASVTINTPRASSAFTHTLQYSLNNSTWSSIATDVATSYSWTLPSALATGKPNAKTGTLYIRCITYSGSTNIGSKTISRTYNITSAYAAPSVALSASQTNSAGVSLYVKGISTVTLKATVTTKYSATAAKYVFKYGSTTKTVTSNSSSESVSFLLPSNASASLAYSVTITDTRGYTANKSGTISTTAYAAPVLTNVAVVRGTYTDGIFTEESKGNSLQITASNSFTALGNANAKRYKIEYRLANSTTYTTLVAEKDVADYSGTITEYTDAIFSENAAYVVRLTLLDSFNTVSQIVDVPSQKVLMNFSANGKAMCIGGIANTDNALEIALEAYLTGGIKPMQLASETDFDEIVKAGLYIGNAASGEYVNTPMTTGTFILEVSSAGSAGQLMQRYSYCSKNTYRAYVRFYYSSAWGDWQPTEGFTSFEVGTGYGNVRFANGFMVQWGRLSMALTEANTTVSVDITFPVAFTRAPSVMAHAHTSAPQVVGVSASVGSSTGMTIYLNRTNTIATWVTWIAVGRG